MIGNKNTAIELMSPAGNFESLRGAIQGGADSVYFGVGTLNMRAAKNRNFSIGDLPEVKKTCDEHRVKAYVTLNTVMYDEDLPAIREVVRAISDYNLDGIIASDLSVIQYARELDIPVHISTQANVSNLESLAFFAGFSDVMVLARELSLSQVAEICQSIGARNICGPTGELVRIEAFAHGALCMAISGKCYLSLHEKNKSANRGECQQLCRHAYFVTDKEDGHKLEVDNEYIMSPKDLCTITFLDKLLDAGVRVLKIEGRGRPPEYVLKTTRCYREAIDAWGNGVFTREKAEYWEMELRTVFNRGFWEGYYMGRREGEWSDRYGSSATRRKVYVGKGLNYFSRIGVAEFILESQSLKVGDEVIITGPASGVIECRIEEIRVDLEPVNEVFKGQRFSIPVSQVVRRSDRLFKIVNTEISAV